MTPIQQIIWTGNARYREQIFLLRLLDVYGLMPFTATLEEISQAVALARPTVIRCVKGLKEMGYIKAEKLYGKLDGVNLPIVAKCTYKITLEKEPANF